MSTDRHVVAFVMICTAATCFVINAGVSRVVLRAGVDPATLTTLRVSGAVLVLAAWAATLRPWTLRPPRGRRLLVVTAMGLVGVAALQWTYFVAIDRLPVGLALLLQYTAPVLVAVYVRTVRHEDVRPRAWVALGLSLTGLALVAQIWQGLTVDGLGVLAGLGAAVCFAAYFLLGETGVHAGDPLSVVLWSFLVAAVVMNVVAPVTGLDAELLGTEVPLLGTLSAWSAPVWVLLCWVVVLGTVIPFALELFTLRVLPATVVIVVMMLEPVGVSVLGWAWFGESLTGLQLIGSSTVVAGIALAVTARRVRVAEPPPLG